MCGRYAFAPGDDFYDRYAVSNRLDQLPLNYNVTPGSVMPVITRHSPNNVELMRWGLVPRWSTDPRVGLKMINARSESVSTKPSFRQAFRHQRCLVPATGFFEWRKAGDSKSPYYFYGEKYLAFAGLYEIGRNTQKTYTIITAPATGPVAKVHDRMPVILGQKEEDIWLSVTTSEAGLRSILTTSGVGLDYHPVSALINSPENNSPSLIDPIS